MATDSPPLLSLPPDALRAILCRVPALDHNSLRLACQSMNAVVNSEGFRRERALSGWAEVQATLVTKHELYRMENPSEYAEDGYDEGIFEQYDNDLGRQDSTYGYHDIEARIWVDEKRAGSSELVLVPRSSWEQAFHEATDAHSSDLQGIAWAYCDARGRPRLRSVREATRGLDVDCSKGGFIYIQKLEVEKEYRVSECTNVTAAAVRSVLCGTKLKGKWTLAVYEAYFLPYFEEVDRQRMQRIKDHDLEEAGEIREDDRALYTSRADELSKIDARMFIRAGFLQATEMIRDGDSPYHLFAAEPFLSGNMMTKQLAKSYQIVERQALPEEPTGVNKELLDLVKDVCSERKGRPDVNDPVLRQQMLENAASLREIHQNRTQAQNSMNRLEQMLSEAQQALALQLAEPLTQEQRRALEGLRSQVRQMDTTRDEMLRQRQEEEPRLQEQIQAIERIQSQINERESRARADIDHLDSRIRNGASRLVHENGATVQGSDSLHCCAANHLPQYLDLLLDLVPQEQRDAAINALDFNGNAPLMIAAETADSLDAQYECCKRLIDLGADKGKTNPITGKTALGFFCSGVRSESDFRNCFSARSDPPGTVELRKRLEKLLMPVGGPAAADADEDFDSDNDDEDENDEAANMSEDEDMDDAEEAGAD